MDLDAVHDTPLSYKLDCILDRFLISGQMITKRFYPLKDERIAWKVILHLDGPDFNENYQIIGVLNITTDKFYKLKVSISTILTGKFGTILGECRKMTTYERMVNGATNIMLINVEKDCWTDMAKDLVLRCGFQFESI